jgi:hypothetical protein
MLVSRQGRKEPRADPAAALLLADDERDHARPRLVVLERPLRADPAESRDGPVHVDDGRKDKAI